MQPTLIQPDPLPTALFNLNVEGDIISEKGIQSNILTISEVLVAQRLSKMANESMSHPA